MKRIRTIKHNVLCEDDFALAQASDLVFELSTAGIPEADCFASVFDADTGYYEYFLFSGDGGLYTYDLKNHTSDHILLIHT